MVQQEFAMNDLDIRIKASFKDHRKRKKLAARLGPVGVLALIDLWLTAAETHMDGWLDGYTIEDIEIDAGWVGEPGQFARALMECGFLDKGEHGYTLHDWAEHQSWLCGAPARSTRAAANVNVRWERERARKASSGIQPVQPQDTTGIQPVYKENTAAILPSLPSLSLPIPTSPIHTASAGVHTKPCRNGYTTWTQDQFRAEALEANHDGLLSPDELENFCAYWFAPTPTGRELWRTQKSWSMRLRLQTALRMIYGPERTAKVSTSKPQVDFDEARRRLAAKGKRSPEDVADALPNS